MGRSNVGKSSLINALVRRRLARTSSAPGKTRLANFYRVARGLAPPLYLVDLPGYGYARGGGGGFEALTRAYFERGRREGGSPVAPAGTSAILLVDARHPGLESDLTAWRWVKAAVDGTGVVATKIDKLARGQRIRAMGQLESVFEGSVLPVSAVTGEGMDELWRLIDKLANRRSPNRLPRATGRRPPKK